MQEFDYRELYLRSGRVARDIVREARIQARESGYYIFNPTNELEEVAIALATEGKSGWKGSLYSLNYFDRYLENICFIFTTQPQSQTEEDNSWLLIALDSSDHSRYWVNLNEKLLSEVHAAWAKVLSIPNPKFDPQRMAGMS